MGEEGQMGGHKGWEASKGYGLCTPHASVSSFTSSDAPTGETASGSNKSGHGVTSETSGEELNKAPRRSPALPDKPAPRDAENGGGS